MTLDPTESPQDELTSSPDPRGQFVAATRCHAATIGQTGLSRKAAACSTSWQVSQRHVDDRVLNP